MKKFITILLVLAMTFSFIACSKKENEEPTTPSVEPTAEPEPTAETEPEFTEETEPTEEEPVSEYLLACECNGAKVFYNPAAQMTETGNLGITLRIDATNSTDNIAVKLNDCSINGFGVSAPTQLMTMAGDVNEFTLGLCTKEISEYGIKDIAELKAGFSVYTYDEETYELNLPSIAEVEPVGFTPKANITNTELSLPGEPIYDKDGVKVYSIQTEEEYFSSLALLVINETEKDLTVVPYDLEMNGEKQDVDYIDYAIYAKANTSTFAVIPLMNYSFDEEAQTITKIEVTSYKLDFTVSEAVALTEYEQKIKK